MPRFNGPEYKPEDHDRLMNQYDVLFRLMSDGKWRTLPEIEALTGYPPSSISAQLRHMRKERFGAHTVNRKSRGARGKALFEYQVIKSEHVYEFEKPEKVKCKSCKGSGFIFTSQGKLL